MIFSAMFDDNSDEELFTCLYKDNERKMYAVAYSILSNQQKAEDVVHDSFLKIIRHFDKYKQIPSNEVEGWIVIIVKNTARDTLKKDKRLVKFPEQWDIASDENTEQISRYKYLVSVIRSMPENYRVLLELKLVLEWTNTQLAEYFNVNENTIAARLFRARKKLTQQLEKEGYTNNE